MNSVEIVILMFGARLKVTALGPFIPRVERDQAPARRQPFLNNQVPALGAFAQLWLQNCPQPTMAANANHINYRANLASSNNYDEYLARGDWNISAKKQLFGTVARFTQSGSSNTITPGLFVISVPLTGTNASITDTQIINDHLVNALKIGYNRSNLFRTQQGTGAKNYAILCFAESEPPPATNDAAGYIRGKTTHRWAILTHCRVRTRTATSLQIG